MKKIKNKIMLPVYIMAALFIVFMALQIMLIFTNLNSVREMESVNFATNQKSSELKLSVVQVQQWLTDISATRAAEGFDDGYAEAEENADKVRALISELKEINPKNVSDLDGIADSFTPYYETGKKMAAAYISQGPEGGNLMMGEFDTVAEEINGRVDLFMEDSNKAITASILEIERSIQYSVWLAIAAVIGALLVSAVIRIQIGKNVVKPIDEVRGAARQLAAGDLKTDIGYRAEDETGQMADDMRATVDALNRYISESIHLLDQLGKGNLSVRSQVVFQGDFVELGDCIKRLSEDLTATMIQIGQSADQVYSGSDQVSNGAQILSQGAAEQASAVEQLSATIMEISEQVSGTAQSADEARGITVKTKDRLGLCNQDMQEMMLAMGEITDKSKEIGKIMKVIEDIAFQTNILALNAAVEAARAGAAGKGFSVVADEVRNLASKSAEASKSTAVLIEGTTAAVENGREIARKTAGALLEVVDGTQKVVEMVEHISEAAGGQATSVQQIAQGVNQISSVVQTNSATAEESAAASKELSYQAELLKGMIKKFSYVNM